RCASASKRSASDNGTFSVGSIGAVSAPGAITEVTSAKGSLAAAAETSLRLSMPNDDPHWWQRSAAAALTASHCVHGLSASGEPQSLQYFAPVGLTWAQK